MANQLRTTLLTHLIDFITNPAYFSRLSGDFVAPGTARRGAWPALAHP